MKITQMYHYWRGTVWSQKGYVDVPGFCKSATLEDIAKHGYVLTPGRYVGAEDGEDDGEPFDEKMRRLSALWREQWATAARLDAAIETNLKGLGFLNATLIRRPCCIHNKHNVKQAALESP
ncbi:MAG: N-6 DNA methylase [Acidithiobacillus caldus]|nr:N-6 DNA methylase [Acidithiobacillus caldus]